MVTLITGGARSGKSRQALKIATSAKDKAFIATAQPLDEEMSQRISQHQAEREAGWDLYEESVKLADCIERVAQTHDLILIDCLTLWLFHLGEAGEETTKQEISRLLTLLKKPSVDIIFVTNEIGLGLVPEAKESREFRDQMGFLNQQVAELADQVIFMVSGQPLIIKNSHES